MSLTLKPWAVALLIATFAVLVGFSVGQITAANSGSPKATTSSDYQIVSQLKKINSKLGATYNSSSVLGMLDDIENSNKDIVRGVGTSDYGAGIRGNTYEMCQALKDSFSC